jgi:large subunit ribosomal protein L4
MLRQVSTVPEHIAPQSVHVTVHSFPKMEPIELVKYPSSHLLLPLRRDILHRAVIYEGDKTRRGMASSKWRSEVHGSGKKLRAQKGSGRARVGDKKSPTRIGGGVAHGPKPRDFSTGLPKKLYDKAWRTALSYRFRRGDLIVIDKLQWPHRLPVKDMIAYIQAMRGIDKDRLFLVTETLEGMPFREDLMMKKYGDEVKLRARRKVDVKNLLEMDKLIIEKTSLDRILNAHQSDLINPVNIMAMREQVADDAVTFQQALQETLQLQEAEYQPVVS